MGRKWEQGKEGKGGGKLLENEFFYGLIVLLSHIGILCDPYFMAHISSNQKNMHVYAQTCFTVT